MAFLGVGEGKRGVGAYRHFQRLLQFLDGLDSFIDVIAEEESEIAVEIVVGLRVDVEDLEMIVAARISFKMDFRFLYLRSVDDDDVLAAERAGVELRAGAKRQQQ